MSEKKLKIDSSVNLKTFISSVIEEGVKSALARKALTEKEKQEKLSTPSDDEDNSGDDVDALFGGGDDSDSDEGDSTSSKTMDDETEKLKKGDVDVKDIVEKLNSIRSGRSFKDEHVSKSMDEYFNSLSKPERVALLAFLKGISQIVTGEVEGEKADEPGDSPSNVKMKKVDAHKERTIKPNVIKAPSKDASQKKGSAEDTSAPVPITPKKR